MNGAPTGDPRWIETALRALVSTSSPSGGERAALDLVEGWLAGLGGRVRRVPIDAVALERDHGFASPTPLGGAYALTASWGAAEPDAPRIVLNGHIDTVAAGADWTVDPLASTVEDGRLTGLGSADMKGGIVGAIAAVARLLVEAGQPRGEIVVHVVPDEEAGGGTGTLACVTAPGWRAPDLVVVCEPTLLDVCSAQVGSHALRLTVTGRSAHANTKHLGVSATEAMIDLLGRVRSWEHDHRADRHPLLGPVSVNVGLIAGGTGATSVAAHCAAEACVTFHPRHNARLADELQGIVDGWAAIRPEGTQVRLETLHHVAPFESDADGPAVRQLLAARAALLGPGNQTVGFPTGSDGRLYAREGGATVVIFGPGDVRTIHAPDEWIDLDQVDRHAEVLREFFTRTMQAEPNTGETT